MISRSVALTFGLLVLITLSTLLQVAVADETNKKAFNQQYERTIYVRQSEPAIIDFHALYSGALEGKAFTVTIQDPPKQGRLLSMTNNRIISESKKTADNDRFRYLPITGFNGNVEMNITLEISKGESTNEVTIEWARIILTVKDTQLYARRRRYQVYAGGSKTIQLDVRKSRRSYDKLKPDGESTLKSVMLTTLPQADCKLYQVKENGDKDVVISETPATVTSPISKLVVEVAESAKPGLKCTFYYRGVNKADQPSNDAPVTVAVVKHAAPSAFPTTISYHPKTDAARPISLMAQPSVIGEQIKYTLLSLPTKGKLYMMNDTVRQPLPDPIQLGADNQPAVIATRTDNYRVVLVYKMDEDLKAGAGDMVKDEVTFKWKATGEYGDSNEIINTIRFGADNHPKCGTSRFYPVFWDKVVNPIRLNFTDPTGRGIDRVVLSRVPRRTIGHLYFKRPMLNATGNTPHTQSSLPQAEATLLRIGDSFTDEHDGVYYKVDPENKGRVGNDIFSFRAYNNRGESCRGKLIFEVVSHDGGIKDVTTISTNDGDAEVRQASIRKESAYFGQYTLIPLWGPTNQSYAGISGAMLKKMPTRGKLFAVTSAVNLSDTKRLYRRQRVGHRPYCKKYDCTKMIDTAKPLHWGDEVAPLSGLDAKPGFPTVFVVYQAPSHPVNNTKERSQFFIRVSEMETFDYQFTFSNSPPSDVNRVQVYLTKGSLPTMTVKYDKKDVWNWDDFAKQRLKAIRVKIIDMDTDADAPKKEIRILETDTVRRHGKAKRYNLYNFNMEGDRVVPTKLFEPSTRHGITGLWVDHDGALALVPTITSRSQTFTFRARIYTKKNFEWNDETDKNNYQDYRVKVVRRDNTIPTWNDDAKKIDKVPIDATTGKTAVFKLGASDAEWDEIHFKIIKGPKKGTLIYSSVGNALAFTKPLRTGSWVIPPRGDILYGNTTVEFTYVPVGRSSQSYPQQDYFLIVADDGSGMYTEPVNVSFNIQRGASLGRHSGANRLQLATVSIVTVAALLIAAVVTGVIVRRRMAKQRYMQLQREGGGASGGSRGGQTEMRAVRVTQVAAPKLPTASTSTPTPAASPAKKENPEKAPLNREEVEEEAEA